MNMHSQAVIDELMKIHPKGFDLSLDRVGRLLEALGNPHLNIPPAIHIAGTNGKGSTIAFSRAILEAAGYSVHVHTSPHLVNWNERYRLGKRGRAGELVDDRVLAEAIGRVADANSGKPITVFEILSATMFLLFSEHEADFSLIEVGLGGRFDATNIIEEPLLCVIAPVSMDHVAYLGDTLSKIAFEKAGIIKEDRPVVIGVQEDEALERIIQVAEKHHSPSLAQAQDFDCYEQSGRLVYQDENGLLDLPLPALRGEHQIQNAGLAIAAIRHAKIAVTEEAFAQAMEKVTWPGRMEPMPRGKLANCFPNDTSLWIDGGHNPSAGKIIAEHLAEMKRKSGFCITLICAMLTTKEPEGYFKPFTGIAENVLCVPVVSSDSGFDPEILAQHARNAGLQATAFDTIDAAMEHAERTMAERTMAETTKEPQLVLFCGSLYHVGHMLDINGTPPK